VRHVTDYQLTFSRSNVNTSNNLGNKATDQQTFAFKVKPACDAIGITKFEIEKEFKVLAGDTLRIQPSFEIEHDKEEKAWSIVCPVTYEFLN